MNETKRSTGRPWNEFDEDDFFHGQYDYDEWDDFDQHVEQEMAWRCGGLPMSPMSPRMNCHPNKTNDTNETVSSMHPHRRAETSHPTPCVAPLSFSSRTAVSHMQAHVDALHQSIHDATRVQLTGRGGAPVYHALPLSDCEVLQPVGRWKFRFAAGNAVHTQGNAVRESRRPLQTSTNPANPASPPAPAAPVRLSPSQLVETELRIGTVVVDCFRRGDIVTVHSRHDSTNSTSTSRSNDTKLVVHDVTRPTIPPSTVSTVTTLTISIAEPGPHQLAVILLWRHVSLDLCRAVGLHAVGDTARLDHVIHYLTTKSNAQSSGFQVWSIGIPATLMSQCLYSSLMTLPRRSPNTRILPATTGIPVVTATSTLTRSTPPTLTNRRRHSTGQSMHAKRQSHGLNERNSTPTDDTTENEDAAPCRRLPLRKYNN